MQTAITPSEYTNKIRRPSRRPSFTRPGWRAAVFCAIKNTVDCTKPNTGIINRLDSLPAQEKPAMASTPRPPSSPCLTVVMMVPLAC